MKTIKIVLLLLSSQIIYAQVNKTHLFSVGQNIYVSPKGNDKNAGTKAKPVASFAKAQTLASKTQAGKPVNVIFMDGIYYLSETVHFTADDSKSLTSPIKYTAEHEGKAIISGGLLLKLNWKPWQKGIYKAQVPNNVAIDQLYINGVRQRMARFPNAVAEKNVFDTWELDHNAKADAATNPLILSRTQNWVNPEGGYIHAMHNALWGDMHWVIQGKNPDGTLKYEGGWQNNRPSAMHPLYRMVENVFEELDVEGEWFYNKNEHSLYYMPASKTDLKMAKVEVVRLKHLVEFNGSKEKPVSGISLEGFVFRHAARTFMDNKEPLLRSDWTVYRGGAVVFNGAEDCNITDCEFDQVGGNTIFVNNYNRRITVKGCYIQHSGANGIAFVGDPATVRNPLFRYGNQDFKHLDKTPGAKGDNFPEDCLVEDCLITMTGRDEKQTAPVHIAISHKIRVNHCSIYDVPRAGININEGTFGGNIIEHCDIFNTVLETGDHGSFNSWGRDRFWTPEINETVAEVAKEPTLPFWDILEPNILRNNRWRCDHGWDIDLDDGSTSYRIYNNLLLRGGLKMREGYDRIATNNIIINNSLHPHVWYQNSGDVFKNNIVFMAYRPAVMNKSIAQNGKWGKELDYNFFVSNQENMKRYAQNGCDEHSLNGDAVFVNPEKGDFRVKDTSPALKIGFINFPLDNFGVTKPSLKAIAKTPVIPTININTEFIHAQPNSAFTWMGTSLKEPQGDELSAYGLGFDEIGVALLDFTDDALATKLGFNKGDLIQTINGVKISNIQSLKEYVSSDKAKLNLQEFVIIRNQAKQKLNINQAIFGVLIMQK